ncbi:hypothetical protein GCM10011331_16810 [Flavimobilis marinus]|uniref:Tfp pilus assembly protein PilN n=1 Tax=Flavimobilis marinus TaxID=285351 RepID=A0A1I2FEJ7_9MICO|nr:hypothetical protein [Flavimobilis marinus]GHG52273.1 hypothetical protein GCM10011331_16810 [Flavimobilis marinus]SFF03675.1 hypothetical protein SAMN04488035_1277 [Flavimobilis marinus]
MSSALFSKKRTEAAAQPSTKVTRTGGVVAGASALPQVNLLPQWVREGRNLRRLKVLLGIAVLAVVLLAVTAWFTAQTMASNAKEALETEQTRTAALLREQSQYAAVPAIKGQITATMAARNLAVAFDVPWLPMTTQLYDTAPDGSTITVVNVTTMTPMQGAPVVADAITRQGVATVLMTAESDDLIDTTEWLKGLAEVPGVVDPVFTTQALGQNAEGDTVYTVEASAQIDASALVFRFTEEEGN